MYICTYIYIHCKWPLFPGKATILPIPWQVRISRHFVQAPLGTRYMARCARGPAPAPVAGMMSHPRDVLLCM